MKIKRSFISILLCLALLFSSFAALNAVQVSAADTTKSYTGSNTKYSTEEVILQCWNWPVSTIRSQLSKIAEAGFTAIQTSPINGIVGSGNSSSDNTVDNWYQFYQPKNYTIGNKICTKDEFTALCKEAHALGMKVIVDVVLNHTTDYTSAVDSSLQVYHGNGGLTDWDDRYQQTQKDITNMPDLDTSNSNIQSQARTLLQNILNAGADGFRFDAAKHIELPSGDELSGKPTSNYWPTVLNNLGDKFSYGEVLAGQNVPLAGYSKYMNITGSAYSDTVRNNISSNVLKASDLTDYKANLGGGNLVCWVESHDNYMPNGDGYGNFSMPKYQVTRAWAALTAQGLNTLYMARPYGSTSSNWKGSNKTSDGGNGDYFDAEVVGVNKFHNACKGTASNVYNYNNNNQILVIQRGSKGVCIINTGSSTVSVNVGNMASGSYTDLAHNKNYTASNGSLTVSVAPGVYPIALSSGSGESSLSDCYLHGWIGDKDYTGTDYHFDSNGKLTATFNSDTYVYIYANGTNYKTAEYVDGTSGNFYTGNNEKMKVPAGTVTFTLKKISGGFSLSYTTSGGSTKPTTPTTPTTPSADDALYLNVPSTYEVSTPSWYIWTWGTGTGKAVKGVKDSVSGYYKFTDFDSNVIFLRVANGKTFDGSDWSNKTVWNQSGDIKIPSGSNLYKIKNWSLEGDWSTYAPPAPKYDYTVKYIYDDYNGKTNTITKTVSQTTETDAKTIAEINDPSSKLKDPKYSYSIVNASKSGTTVTAYLTKTEKKYSVNVNGRLWGTYSFMDQATVTSATQTGFVIDGKLAKFGNEINFFVTGDIDVTFDANATHEDAAILTHTGTYLNGTKLSLELLATANVEGFKRMGVAFSSSSKTQTQIANAVNSVTDIGTAKVVNKIAVHNSAVDYPNSSGQYQFRYAPSMSISSIPSNASLYFYTYAVTDNAVVVSDGEIIPVASITA